MTPNPKTEPENPPAFPFHDPGIPTWTEPHTNPGMSLRDYFAAKAMAAMLSNPANYGSEHEWRDDATVSEQAYEIADDMMKERAK